MQIKFSSNRFGSDRSDETALASLGGFLKKCLEVGVSVSVLPVLSPNEIAFAMAFDLIVLITCISVCVLIARGNNINAYARVWYLF